jgi:predicted PurR-regulated permease PerM
MGGQEDSTVFRSRESKPMALNLTDRQTKTVSVAVTIMAVVIILVAFGALVFITGWFLRFFSNVFLPIAVGGIAALVFRPYYQWLCSRLRLPRAIALVVVFLSMVLPLAAFLWFFGSLIVHQFIELASRAPEWWKDIVAFIQERWPQVKEFLATPRGRQLQETLAAQQEYLMQGLQIFGGTILSAGAGVLRGVGMTLSWAVLPVYFAFFLMSGPKEIDGAQILPFLKPETRDDVMYLFHEFIDIMVAFFRGQLIVAFLQGLLYAVGFSLVGLKYGFVIGLLLGFLNIIPYLGSIIGLSIALPLSLFQTGGGFGLLVAVLVVFTVVQLVESYLLTPKIMGDRTGLHFIAIIFAVFFWGTALGGVMGMLLAIPLTAFLASLWRLAKEKYISEIV